MISINGIKVDPIHFPAGELGVHLSPDHMHQSTAAFKGHYDVEWRFEHSGEFFVLAQIIDALKYSLRGHTKPKINLFIPYFPYARQDRVVNDGEANALMVFCKALNTLSLESISTLDPHSLALEQHFDVGKFDYLTQVDGFEEHAPPIMKNDISVVIAPDAGAVKKAQAIADLLGADLVVCSKTRDKTSGKVVGLTVSNPDLVATAKNILVADDICDGGATFIAVAGQIAKISQVPLYLYTSHGIYSKGKAVLLNHYDEIACAYDFNRGE